MGADARDPAAADGRSRERILDAAVLLIAERGVHDTRLADVAERAGVSLGLVQHYFRKRERLLAEVFRREQRRITDAWEDVVERDAEPLLRLVRYLRLCSPEPVEGVGRDFDRGWSFWLEFWARANRDPAVQAEVRDVYADFASNFTDAIGAGIGDGTFRPRGSIEDVVDRLISLIDGLAVRTLIRDVERARMLPLLIDGLAAELGLDEAQRERAFALANQVPDAAPPHT